MKEEYKDILSLFLCSNLPYGVKCKLSLQEYIDWNPDYKKKFEEAKKIKHDLFDVIENEAYTIYGMPTPDRVMLLELDGIEETGIPIEMIKPYLRLFDTMTADEHNELFKYSNDASLEELKRNGYTDYLRAAYVGETHKYEWLRKNHFDYMYMIEKGIALEAGDVYKSGEPIKVEKKKEKPNKGYIIEDDYEQLPQKYHTPPKRNRYKKRCI